MTVAPRAQLLHALANADVALLLILAGIFLLYAEFNRPGNVVLGSSGAFAFMLGIYGLAQHPIRPIGAHLLVVGLALLLLELRFNTRNLFGALATGILIAGLVALIPGPTRIHPLVAAVAAPLFTAVTLILGRIALRARRNKRTVARAPHPPPSTSPIPE